MSIPRRIATAVLAALMVVSVLPAMPALAQTGSSSEGTDFWLAFPTNYSGTPELSLYLASDRSAEGTVAIPAIGFAATFSTTPGQVTTVRLPTAAQLSASDGIESAGVHVTATEAVSVYGLNRIQYTTDAYMGLPTSMLGSEYLVMSHPSLSAYGSELAVVAPSDGTEVTIVPSVSTGSRQQGVAYTLQLDRGETYQLRASGTQDLSGTIVTASKPVAVFGGASCANVPVGYRACDHLVEQMTPPNTWGSSFAVMPLATRVGGDTFRFLAASDSTAVLVNGETVATLDKGEVHQRVLEGPSHITSSSPILVAQFSNGSSFDGVVSDPFMMLIPPYEQFRSHYTVATPATGFRHNFINLVSSSASRGTVSVDGLAVPAADWVAIGDSGFHGAQVAVESGSHVLEGTGSFGAFVYGFDDYDSYGYPAGMNLRRFDSRATMFGHRRAAGYVSDPVNTGTGNLVDTVVDLDFGSAIWGMELGRTYNSLDDSTGLLGRGWSTTVRSWVSEDVDGTVWLHEDDGRVVAFQPVDGGYSRPEELFGDLHRDDDGTLSVRFFDGSVDDFDGEGRLVERRRWDGQSVAYVHDEAGLLTEVVHSHGPSLDLTYADGRLVSAAADDGRTVLYGYDAEGNLASVTDPAGSTTTYESDELGRILRITDARGDLVVGNTYDPLGRVVAQELPSGGSMEFSYDLGTRVTTVTDVVSGDVNRYHHDPVGRLVQVTDAVGAVLTKSYDTAGNLVSSVDRRAETRQLSYDERGNVTSATDPSGATHSWVYDESSRVISETDAAGAVTTYGYVGDSRVPTTATDAVGGVTTVDVVGGLVRSIADADGVTTTLEHDGRRNVIAVMDGEGGRTTYGYDPVGRQTAATSPSGATTTFTYDPVGRLLSTTDAVGATATHVYDADGDLVSTTDPTGATTTFVYDAGGNLVETVDANGNVTTNGYDANGELVSETRPGGATTTYEYGPLGRLESITDPVGAVTRFGFDADGNVVAMTDALGAKSSTTYDARGLVVAETDALGHTTSFAYDPAGRVVSETDANGATTSYEYDPAGRLVAVADADGGVERRTYTAAGRLASTIDATGATTSYGYDAAGRQVTVTAPDGAVTRSTYDDDGRLATSQSAVGLVTAYGYDPVGQLTTETGPDGSVTSRSYNARGEVVRESDPTGAEHSFGYDPVGNLVEVTDANGVLTRYGFDPRGNRVTRTDAAGGTETWAYDVADRLVSATDQLGRTTTYDYDLVGRLVGVADPSGRVESRSYDAAGRLTGRSWADGTSVTYGYDPVGRRTEMTDEHGVTRYGYDPVGNVVEVVGPDGQRVAYGYDAAGRRTSVTHPDGAMVTMAHDVAGRLSEVKHPLLGATALQWDADGRLVGETLPGGQMRGYAYDAAGRLAGFDQQVAGADRSTTVSRDAAGRITSETTGGVATSYRYDPAGQLLSSSSPSLSTSYAYDVLGRRTSASTNGVPITYSHDPAGQLVSEVVDGAERTYTYDESGRRTGAADSEVSTRYGYDARGLLEVIETTTADGTAVEERRYDGDGTLVEVVRIDPTGVTSSTGLVWDQARPVPEILAMDTDGSQATFAYGVGRIGVVEDGTTAAVFGIDVHGSAITTPATAGFVVAGAYDPFGNPIVDAPATVDCGDRPLHPLDPNHCAGDSAGGNPPDVGNGKGPTRADSTPTVLTTTELPSRPALGFGYRGELHSDDLVHLRARDYDPSTGAFTTRDPLDGVNGTTTVANPYHYAENDPLNRTDPSGLRPEDDDFDHESARSGGPMLHCGRFIGPCLPSSVARPRDVTTCPNRCWMSDRNLRFESSMFPDHRRWDGVLVISTQRLAQPPSSSSWYVPVFPIIDPRAAEYGWWSIGRDSDRQVDTGRGFLVTGSADTGTVLVQSVRYEAITDTSRIGIGTETNNPGPGIDLNTSRGTTYRVVEHLGYAEYFRETVYVFTRLGYGYVDDVL